MNSKLKTQEVEQLFDAILSLEDRDECFAFFEDICTINELLSLAQRLEVAKMLRKHRTYMDIA
jgi:TrpR-related protein YerC/YecD